VIARCTHDAVGVHVTSVRTRTSPPDEDDRVMVAVELLTDRGWLQLPAFGPLRAYHGPRSDGGETFVAGLDVLYDALKEAK
jgi:hypothetical protein